MVPPHRLHARALAQVPHLTGAVDAAADALVAFEVELRGADLPAVPRERHGTLPRPHIPQLHGVVKAAGDDGVPLSVKGQRHDLGAVAGKHGRLASGVHIPQSSCVIHAARGQHLT